MGTYSNLQVRVLCRNTNIAILHIAHPGYVGEGAEGNRHFGQVAIYPEWRPDVFMEEQLTWKKNTTVFISFYVPYVLWDMAAEVTPPASSVPNSNAGVSGNSIFSFQDPFLKDSK